MPALAWWIGWTLGNLVYWVFVMQVHDLAAMTGVISAATFGLLTPVENALAPITLFTAGDVAFGFGFPWTLVIIYAGVFWNRGRRRRLATVNPSVEGNVADVR